MLLSNGRIDHFSLPFKSLWIYLASITVCPSEKFSLNFSKCVVCNPFQSSPSSTSLVPSWFIFISLAFFYFSDLKVLISGILHAVKIITQNIATSGLEAR